MEISTALKVDKALLGIFWKLAESDEQGIVKATHNLLAKLDECQKKSDNTKLSGDLAYTLKRLVKGLASSRESARQGYSVALCQLLRKFSIIRTEDVLLTINDCLQISGNLSKSDTGNISLGIVLAYLTLIQSGRLVKDVEAKVHKVIKKLMSIRNKKSYLQQICTNAIVLIVSQVDTDAFKQYVWPEVVTDLQLGWEQCTPDTLHLLLACRKYHPEALDKKFMKAHWHRSSVITEKNFSKIWNIILKTTEIYPVLHVVSTMVVQEISDSGLSLVDFWKTGLEMIYQMKGKGGKTTGVTGLEIHMLAQTYPLATSAEEMSAILDPRVISQLLKIVDGKMKTINPLFSVARQLLDGLVKYMKDCEKSDVQLVIMKKFVDDSLKQGRESASVTEPMKQSLKGEAAKKFGKYLMQKFTDSMHSSKSDNTETPSNIWDIVSHIRSLVTMPTTSSDHAWHLELLQFLALHSFWIVNKSSHKIHHCQKAVQSVDEKLRKKCQDNFLKSLHNLLVYRSEKSKMLSVVAYIDTLYQLVQYIQVLLQEETTVSLVTPISSKVREKWDEVYAVVEDIRATHEETDIHKSDSERAFELLLLHNMIQLFIEPKETISLLEDIVICRDKIKKNRRTSSKKDASETEWIEVLTELLISMMSQDSSLARVTANSVFSALVDYLTPGAVKLIMNVLTEKQDKDSNVTFVDEDGDMEDEDEMIDEDEEEEEEDMEILENGDAADEEEEEEDDSESEDEEDDDNVDDDDYVGDEFRKSVKQALGNAASLSDEDESEEDLSDSEMFKLDAGLVAVFKAMKKNNVQRKKENQKQLIIFKSRVLDLVETLIKSQPSAEVVLEMVLPVLEMVLYKDKEIDVKVLGNRASGLCQLMYKRTKVHGDNAVSKDVHLDYIRDILQFTTKVPNVQMVGNEISNMCLLVIRLLLNLEEGSTVPSPVKTRSQRAKKGSKEENKVDIHKEVVEIIQERVENLLQKKDLKINPAFFVNMLSKYPVLFWPIKDTLLQAIKDDQTKVYSKTQACSMLSVMLNKSTMEGVGEEEWSDFITDLKQTLTRIIMDSSPKDIKMGYWQELLVLINKILLNLAPEQQLSMNTNEMWTNSSLSLPCSHNWNSLFLGANAVADVLSEMYSTSKSQILDAEQKQSLGVRMALGETQIVASTRDFLVENGVALDSFSQPSAPRSKTVLLVKNLPASTKLEELRTLFSKYGNLGRVLLPPSGVTAIIEYLEPSDAKNGFRNLAYTKFQHLPLYLEWAPTEVFKSTAPVKSKNTPKKKVEPSSEEESSSDEENEESQSTIFVKNLNFKTTEKTLKKKFAECGTIKSVTIAKKKDLKNSGELVSMGYGFVEFKHQSAAEKALQDLQHVKLEGHALELKLSSRMANKPTSETKSKKKKQGEKKQTTSKILVRNIPFEATRNEVYELFKVFGELKTVRLPKKMSSGSHRGFGFVDFLTKHDAKRAFEALCHSTHLYGRRLVLEWADTADDIEDLRKKTADHFYDDASGPSKRLKKSDIHETLEGSSL